MAAEGNRHGLDDPPYGKECRIAMLVARACGKEHLDQLAFPIANPSGEYPRC